MPTRVHVMKEICEEQSGGWRLCLQWCHYNYDDKAVADHEYPRSETGYRFIWRYPNGKLQAARGQARLPSFEVINRLMGQASVDGWGDLEASQHWS